jgi:mannose-1-phosphate guanylyltransferase/mannose-1-phosphate guanylyltransferase/mannose-6-phosphate isomerase
MPSDHAIAAPEPFRQAVESARALAEAGWLVTFGIAPSHPATGYGYIRQGVPLSGEAFAVAAFVEKPDAATAASYLAAGGYFWNAGIFLFRARDMVAALEAHAPDVLAPVAAAVGPGRGQSGAELADPDAFAAARSISIDYAVMEKAERVAVVPVDMGWSDVGSWDALGDISEKDAGGNVVRGDALLLDGSNCTVYSTGPTVTAIGVSDLVVVATKDAVLIVPRGQSQSVADLVAELRKQGRTDLL